MNNIKKILRGDFLDNNFVKKNIWYIIFLIAIFFIYIMLSSYGDIKVGERESIKKTVNNLREKSVMYESELMQQSLQSNVYKQIKRRNLDLIKQEEPIKIIFIKEGKTNGRKKKNNK